MKKEHCKGCISYISYNSVCIREDSSGCSIDFVENCQEHLKRDVLALLMKVYKLLKKENRKMSEIEKHCGNCKHENPYWESEQCPNCIYYKDEKTDNWEREG